MIPQEIQKLSTPEKLQLVEELWADIATHAKDIRLAPEQEIELDQRFAAHEAAPDAGQSWDEARTKLRSKP